MGIGPPFTLAVKELDCEGAPLFIVIRAYNLVDCVKLAHLKCCWPRGSGCWGCLVIQNHNCVMNDFNVRVRINKVDDHWGFGRLFPHK
jgi:hypothetical protein